MCQRLVIKPCLRAAACSAALLMILPLAGCGGGRSETDKGGMGSATEVQRIQLAAGSVNMGAGGWKMVFAEGAVPQGADRDRFLKSRFRPGDVEIDDDSATIEIHVDDSSDKLIGDTTWTLKKGAEGHWQITAAPLPDGA